MQNSWPRAVIFDLDGTLVDSIADLADALNRLLAEAGLAALTMSEIFQMVGDGAVALIERAFAYRQAPLPTDGLERFKQLYAERHCVETRLYPGVLEALQDLRSRGCLLAVATNKPEALSRAILRSLGVENLFTGLAGGDSYPVRKPDPNHLLLLLRDIGVTAGECVMVGDSENDVAAAKAAGMRAIVFSQGYSKVPIDALGADRIIDHFELLSGALEALAPAHSALRV